MIHRCRRRLVHCEISSSIHGLYPLDVGSTWLLADNQKCLQILLSVPSGDRGTELPLVRNHCYREEVVISFNPYKPTIRTTGSKICSLPRWSDYMPYHSHYHCHAGKETNTFLRKFLSASSLIAILHSNQISFPESNQHVESITGIHSETYFSTQCFQTLPQFNSSDGQPLVTQGKKLSSLHLLKSPLQQIIALHITH